MSKQTVVYTMADVGCYVDGCRGIYGVDEIVGIARVHGADIEHAGCGDGHNETCFESEFAGCEWAADYADEATEYMNDQYPVDGATWGYNDGDWGLWADEEDE